MNNKIILRYRTFLPSTGLKERVYTGVRVCLYTKLNENYKCKGLATLLSC